MPSRHKGRLLQELSEQTRHGPDTYVGQLCKQARDEIERLQSMVDFLEEQKRQSEAMREAAMRMAYPDLFPGSGRWPVENSDHE